MLSDSLQFREARWRLESCQALVEMGTLYLLGPFEDYVENGAVSNFLVSAYDYIATSV